ncbi:MAG: hypothetical protein H7833_13045 [Magnetococcus sp. DMHC-1]
MRVLKGFVILGGVLLLAGFGILLYRVIERGWTPTRAIPTLTNALDPAIFTLPADGRITAMTSWGSGIALLVETGQGNQEILGIDAQGVLKRHLRFQQGSMQSRSDLSGAVQTGSMQSRSAQSGPVQSSPVQPGSETGVRIPNPR